MKKYNYEVYRNGWEPVLEMEASNVYEVIELLQEERYSFLKGKELGIICEEDPDQDKFITL